MKSKISFYNKTILRTDITRFAPVWGGYTLFLLLIGLLICGNAGQEYELAMALSDMCRFAMILCGPYALIVSLSLFGDLLNARACNALHAMPLTRDDFFTTHTLAAFLFSWVPTTVVLLALAPMAGKAAPGVLWLLLAILLQHVFYLGTALLAIQLAGNRIASVLLYGLINFLPILAGWFIRHLYEPLMYGVSINVEPIFRLCPTYGFLDSGYLTYETIGERYDELQLVSITPVDGWGTLAIWAVVGVVFLALAQILYRRRKLEAAGDLLAYGKLKPVFLVLFALTVGGFFHVFSTAIYSDGYSWMALMGIAVGWIVGKMLLERQVNVFRWRTVLPMGIFVGLLALSLVLTAQDILGITRKIPELGKIESVTVASRAQPNHRYVTDDPAEMDEIVGMHAAALENVLTRNRRVLLGQQRTEDYSDNNIYVTLTYQMKDGTTLKRTYLMNVASDPTYAGMLNYFQRPEVLFGVPKEDLANLAKLVRHCEVYDMGMRFGGASYSDPPELQGLIDAIVKDAEQGLVQGVFYQNMYRNRDLVVYFMLNEKLNGGVLPENYPPYTELMLDEACTNTMEWLEAHDVIYRDPFGAWAVKPHGIG